MTGFDGLIEARSRQISDVVRRSNQRLVPGTGLATRESTFGEVAFGLAGVGEEVVTKAIGNVLSDDPKYDWNRGIGNYHTQTGFADLFRDAGADNVTAAILGIAAAIVNPLDPLNKLKLAQTTKLGKAAEAATKNSDNLVKEADNIWRISKTKIAEDIAAKTANLEKGEYVPEVASLVKRSIKADEDRLKHVDELNELLVELQQRNVKVEELRLAGSLYDQVRLGQKHLVGFSSPLKFDQLSLFGAGRGAVDDASVVGLGGPKMAALVKGVTGLKNTVVKPLSDAAYKVADYIGVPTMRTEAAKKTGSLISQAFRKSNQSIEEIERELLAIYKQFVDSYGPEGKAAAKNDLLSVVQAMEFRHAGMKEAAIEILSKMEYTPDKLPVGKGAVIETGSGLSADQKLRLTQSGVKDEEIPIAIKQFEEARSPSIPIGKNKEHEAKLLGKYIVIKTSDPKVAASELDELSGIYGNRVWAKLDRKDGTYLVQARHPGARRIVNTDDFEPSHLKNLESIAAQLSNSKKGFATLSSKDILVSPSGAVQIINPSVIVTYKSQKAAVANSRAVLEALADSVSFPRGSTREMPKLKSVAAARKVPKGVDGLTFRVASGGDNVMMSQDLMEQAVNTEGFKDYIRASYDGIEPQELAAKIGDAAEFETANNIDFYRRQIRADIAQGINPNIEPIAYVKDDLGNIHVRSIGGRARLTAAILEGIDAVPIYQVPFVGEVANLVEQGYHVGHTTKLASLWNAVDNSSAQHIVDASGKTLAGNYSLVNQDGTVIKLTTEQIKVNPAVSSMFNRIVTAGPVLSVGKARTERIAAVTNTINKAFGSLRNGVIRIAEIAESAESLPVFVKQIEDMLDLAKNSKGIKLSDFLRHSEAEQMFIQLKQLSTAMLDNMATDGILTATTVNDARRALLASDNSDLVVQVMDAKTNTLKVYGNQATTKHLETSVESFITKTVPVEDVEPYARIELHGVDGVRGIEVKDMVQGSHPRLADAVSTPKVFSISEAQAATLKKDGIYVAGVDNVDSVKQDLQKKGLTQYPEAGGVLLREKNVSSRSTKTGRITAGPGTTAVVRPEFTYFVTRSGSVVIGTKQRNVKDLLTAVFEEGPAYFEEFGVMTTGKIIVSNPFGAKMEKIGIGEVKLLQDRLKLLATRFRELGFSDGTLLNVQVPFDDAVWRSMYGERVTIGEVLSDKFKISIPEQLKNHVPDIKILAPARVGYEAVGVVGIEKTRLANERLQKMFETIEDYADRVFMEQAKAGLPINYYSSWFGRFLTTKAKEALNSAWLTHPDKQSATFKMFESAFKTRVLTDLTTQEVNAVIKRLQKEGTESAEGIISSVVLSMRNGYKLNPTKETADTLIALSKVVPEGIDFFYLDPIWSISLANRQAQRAISRKEIVDSLKSSDINVWHGSLKELNEIKIGKNKEFLELQSEVNKLNKELSSVETQLEKLDVSTPDVDIRKQRAIYQQKIDTLKDTIERTDQKKAALLGKIGTGKVLDTMVDFASEQIWIKGESVMDLINKGVVNANDIIGDPSDAFVRIPIKKYSSVLDPDKTEAFLFPKEVAGAVQKFFGATTKDGFNGFLRGWDTLHSLWRNWTLFPIPSYHVRNMFSNFFMAYLGDVTDPRTYEESLSIMSIIDSHRKGALTKKQVQEALGAISIPSASGQVYSGQQVYDMFVHHGGLAGGLHYNEFNSFGSVVRSSEFERMSVQAGLRPSSELAGSWLFDNSALRLGVSAAALVENRFRLAAFIDGLSKGLVEIKGNTVLTGFESAAMHMKKIFYDYSDLSAFERSWLRRVIPFYSWSRHNIPRMLETIVTDPVKHYRMAEFFHQIEVGALDGAPRDENEIPEWIRERFGIVVNKTKDGNYVMKVGDGFIPMIDAYKMLAGGSMTKMITDGLTPFVKTPIEQLLNYSMFSNKEIERYPGERAASDTFAGLGFSRRATTEGPLGVLNMVLNESVFKTFFRPGGELATKVLDPMMEAMKGESPGFKTAMISLFLGRAYEHDPAQARITIFRNWNRRQDQLTNIRNDAEREGDIKTVDDLDKMLTWLRLQYPGN